MTLSRKKGMKNMKKKITALLLAVLTVLAVLSGCGTTGTGTKGTTDNASTSTPSVTSGEGTMTTPGTDAPDDYVLKVATLKGPTGMGMAKMINDDKDAKKYDFTISSDPTDVTAALVSESLDIAAVPVNLAAVINKKTNGAYLVAAINTLGVLYIVENGNTVNSVADLAGKTVYATGKASTPEYILNYILSKNGLENVTVEYKTEHSELAALMVSGEVVLGMLPEPNVTTVLTKNSSLRIALNLTEEWKKVSEGESVQGCVVVSKKAIGEHGALVNAFLDEYKASVDFVNSNVADAAAMIAELGIVPAAAIAEKAVPNCNIVYIDGDRMVSVLNVFYKVLFDADPKSVGGTLPDESIFYRR